MKFFFRCFPLLPLVLAACNQTTSEANRASAPVSSAFSVAARMSNPTLTGSWRQSTEAIRWMVQNGNRGPTNITFAPDGQTARVRSLDVPEFVLTRVGGPESLTYAGNYPLPNGGSLPTSFTFARGDERRLVAVMRYGSHEYRSSFFIE